MGNLPSLIDPAFLALIRQSFGSDGLPLPFVKEIFLMECRAAGTTHLDLVAIEPELAVQDMLVFRREPLNPHDPLAILILDPKGRKLGYVPREKNEIPARLLDAGKLLFGRLEEKAWQSRWLKLTIRIFMRDL